MESPIGYQDAVVQNFTGLPQGSLIGPLLVNFTLNGLESVLVPSQKTRFNSDIGVSSLRIQSINYLKSASVVRTRVKVDFVRFSDDFIIIINHHEECGLVLQKVRGFLKERGLQLNEEKTQVIKWKNNSKFDYLGFTFHYILRPVKSVLVEQ